MSFNLSRKTGSSEIIEWVVEDRVVRNDVNLIDGRKATGKSSLVSAILGDWWNEENLSSNQVLTGILWLTTEENFDAVVKPRLIQYGIPPDYITTLDYRNGKCPRPILPNDSDKLSQLLGDNKLNAWVIDPFSELKPADWSINDADHMRAYMSAIGAVCSRAKATAFAMRHMRKGKGDYAGDDGMGSVQIKNTARLACRIDATEEKVQRRFFSVHESNIAKPTMPLQFELQFTSQAFGKVKWLGAKDMGLDEIKKLSQEKVQRMKLDDAKRLLAEALKDGPKPCNVLIDEADNAGFGERTLAQAKADMDVWSDRVLDSATGKMYWMWGLQEHQKPSTLTSPEKEMPQLTLEDLSPNKETDPTELRKLEREKWAAELEQQIEDQAETDPIPKPKKVRKTKPKGKGRDGGK